MTKLSLGIVSGLVFVLLSTFQFGCKTEQPKSVSERTKQVVYRELFEIESRNPDRLSSPFSKAGDLIRELQFKASGEPTDSLRLLLVRIADNFKYDKNIRLIAVNALELFPIEQTQFDLERYLDFEEIALPAAALLLKSGKREETLPILIKHEAWYLLREQPDSIAVPILENAASGRSETILGRIKAAQELRRHGDSASELQTARAMMREYLIEDAQVEDMHDFSKAIVECCNILQNKQDPSDIDLLWHGAMNQYSSIQNQCISALYTRALQGDKNAHKTLTRVAKEGESSAVIFARQKLDQLEHKQ